MVNKEKIKIMTKMAIYDNKAQQEDKLVKKYFKKDYISLNNLKEIFFATVFFVIIVGISFIGNVLGENIDIFEMNYKAMIINVVIKYVVMLVVVILISTRIYSRIYDKAKKKLDNYNYNLELLQKFSSNKGE